MSEAKSFVVGKSTQRWSDFDFDGQREIGLAVGLAYSGKRFNPWYGYVEKVCRE